METYVTLVWHCRPFAQGKWSGDIATYIKLVPLEFTENESYVTYIAVVLLVHCQTHRI